MAKKPKNPKPDEAAPDAVPADVAAAVPGGGKKKLIVLAAAAVVLLGGGGGAGYWFLIHKKADDHAATSAQAVKKAAFVDMKEMLVNLSNPSPQAAAERPRYLKLRISLEVSDPKLVAEVTPLLPRIEDQLQVFTRELRSADLEGSAGVYRLKEELLKRVNIAIHPAKIDAVLFKEILIQ